MRQELFRERAEHRWHETEAVIKRLDRKKKAGTEAFPVLYRQLCHDLAIARDRQFDASLVDRLNHLALRGHQHLYRLKRFSLAGAGLLIRFHFPAAVRREYRTILIAVMLLFGSMVLVGFLVQSRPALVYSIMHPEQVRQMEAMYNPASGHFLKPVDQESRFAMFGFYIFDNVGIAFRIFAGGILFGIGSILVVLYNGIYLGAVSGHLILIGYGESFFSFVSSHSALELMAIAISGVTGLKLGWSLIAPGPLRRVESLKRTAFQVMPLLYGSTAMLLLAAIVEAFWSSLQLPVLIKYCFGLGWWLVLLTYFLFSGRRHGV